MKVFGGKRVRGNSLKPGRRKVNTSSEIFGSSAANKYTECSGNVLRIFDNDGRLSVRERGVKQFLFAKLSFFHALQSLSLPAIIVFSALLYIAILFIFTVGYLLWASFCGASTEGVRWTTALYFTIVSLAANGGYLGEPSMTMTEPNSMCFTGRTFIVMILSYSNIIFVGLVAALVVGKAQGAGKIGQRIVFSDLCTLTAAHSRHDRSWRLSFRMANSSSQSPIAHGRLRLFVVTMGPPGHGAAEERPGAAHAGEGVRTCVEEVRWTCPEERHLDAGKGHLSLWFPVTIHHSIARQSPLYEWVEANFATRPQEATGATGMEPHRRCLPFQIVAAFDAVELNSGAIITTKETYTASDIVAHYRFSNRIVNLQPWTQEVELDYHHFNEVVPDTEMGSPTVDNSIL